MNLRIKFTWIINILLVFLLLISVIGSISSIYNQIQVIPAVLILALTICFIVFGIIFSFFPKLLLSITNFIKNRRKSIFIVLVIGTLCWQVLLVMGLSGNTGWDPSMLTAVAAHRSIAWYPDYFSNYPNNFFLLLLERIINNLLRLVGINSYSLFIVILSLISYLLIDLSIFILFLSLKKLFNLRVAIISGVLTWGLIGISPIVVIPYSDIPGFLISSLFLFVYACKETRGKVIVLGVLSGVAFLVKPSLVIFDIALVIHKAFSVSKVNKAVKTVLIFALAFLVVYIPFNLYESHNSIVKIDSSKVMPANHFIAMGMTGLGGFNGKDVLASRKIKSPQARKAYNNRLIKRRLKNFGVAGYTKFLVLKQVNNTSDAGFGWGMDAGPGYLMPFGEKTKLQNITRRLYLRKGTSSVDINWNGYKIINQIIWTIVLIAMIYAILRFKDNYLILKLTILGGLSFLLLFEGGRSRYLIQFLPYIFALASLGINKWISNSNKIKIQ